MRWGWLPDVCLFSVVIQEISTSCHGQLDNDQWTSLVNTSYLSEA